MLRGLVKRVAAHGLERSGLLRLASRKLRPEGLPYVVGYHRVVEDFEASASSSLRSMLTSRRMFEQHLEWMAERFRFAAMAEVSAPSHRESGRPPMVVTFDDGYQDVYDVAFPVLRKMGVPAGVFVVTSLVGTSKLHMHDRLYLRLARWFESRPAPVRALERLLFRHDVEPAGKLRISPKDDATSVTRKLLRALDRNEVERVIDAVQCDVEIDDDDYPALRSLSWDMLDEMQRAGITIGSHTRSHVSLPLESPGEAREEIRRSRVELEERLGTEVRDFAYPDGQFDESIVAAVSDAGYERAFVTCRHRTPGRAMLTIPRKLLWESSCVDRHGRFSSEIMHCQLEWVFDVAAGCEHTHRSVPLPEGGPLLERKPGC